MATIDSVLTKVRNLISRSNTATGRTDADLTNAVNALIDGYGKGGVTPSGTYDVGANGKYNISEYEFVNVAVPSSGINPSGTINITENGEYPISEYEKVNVAVPIPTGMNARVFTVTVASDVTSGNYKILAANSFLASIRNDPNAFVLMVSLNQTASTAMYSLWVIANFVLAYTGSSARKALCVRTTASANNVVGYGGGVSGTNGTGHLQMDSDGSLTVKSCNTTYPLRAGTYLIIGGTAEML